MSESTTAGEIPLAHGTVNGCFGCGEANDAGLRLKFFIDEGQRVLCRVRLAPQFQGPPGHAHGGIIATLLDEAMSKANRRRGIAAMTRHLSIDYLRPVPLESDLMLEGRSGPDACSASGRRHRCTAELRDTEGTLLASATGIFVEVPAEILQRQRSRPGRNERESPAL